MSMEADSSLFTAACDKIRPAIEDVGLKRQMRDRIIEKSAGG